MSDKLHRPSVIAFVPMVNCTEHSSVDSMSKSTAGSRVHIFNCAQRSKETARIDHGIKGSRTDAHHSEKLTLICGLSFTCTRLKSADGVPVSCLCDIQAHTSFALPAIVFGCVRKLKNQICFGFYTRLCVLFLFV